VAPPAAPIPTDGETPLVLVVDDEPAVATMVARGLERHGFRVHVAGGATAALDWLRAGGTPDLLLTDLTMPEMTGDLLADEVRALRPGTPCILATGDAARLAERHASALTAVLEKPFTVREAVQVVQAALEGATPRG
jgi:CheY-like chemotaxis protein